jgi:hypothetical protein
MYMLMNYRLLEFSSINCLRLWRKPEYQEKTTDLWQVDWQTLLQMMYRLHLAMNRVHHFVLCMYQTRKVCYGYRFCLFLPLFWWILEIFRQWYFFVFHLFHIKLLPMYYRFLNSDLFLIEDTKKKQYVYLRGYRSQDKR